MASSRFRFSLERVHTLRRRTEDEAKEALAGAMREQLRSEANVREAAAAVDRARQAQLAADGLGGGAVSGHDLIARQAYLERSEQAHRASRELLHRSEGDVAERRASLTSAARDRQALDRLRDSRRADHDREVARQETETLDEIALGGFRRRAAA